MTTRLGPPPSRDAVRGNVEKPADDQKVRFISARVPVSVFIDMKKSALDEGMTIGDYLVYVHNKHRRGPQG